MSLIEIIAMIFTLVCVYFMGKQNILCWPVGMVGIVACSLIFLREELYFQAGLQALFMIQSVYGWYTWNKGKDGDELPVITQRPDKIMSQVSGVIAISLIVVLFSGNPTSTNALDAVAAGLSILAMIYLIEKKIETWIVWMGVNTILFGLMLYQGIYVMAVLEVILFIISLNAFISWKKDLKMDYV